MMGPEATAAIDARIAALSDWRGDTLTRVRAVIRAAVPEVEEGWKWRGVPTWERDGILVKLTFAKGASLPDPAGLFNSSLDGNVRRAIDFAEGDPLDEAALADLIRAAAALNAGKKKR